MKFSNMLKNPALGGKVLLGGAPDFWRNCKSPIVVTVIVAILFMIILSMAFSWGFTKEGMSAIQGIGPTASHIPGYGTYGYAQALTYNLQREPNELVEQQILDSQRAAGMAYENKLAGKESMSNAGNLYLKEAMLEPLYKEKMANIGDPGKALGISTNPFMPERMTNGKMNILSAAIANGGASEALRRSLGTSESDIPSNEAVRGIRQIAAASQMQENMADIGRLAITTAQDINKPRVPLYNIGLPAFQPEGFSNNSYAHLKTPRRAREHFTGETDVTPERKGAFVTWQVASPNIGYIGQGQLGFQDPSQVDLAGLEGQGYGKYSKAQINDEQAENFGLLPYHKKKGGEISGFTRGYGSGSNTRYTQNLPYSGDQLKYLTLSKDNAGAKVVESDCDQYGRCKISFLEEPSGNFTDLVDVIYELTPSERNELMQLSNKFTGYQLNAQDRVNELIKKKNLANSNSNIKFTGADSSEMKTLSEFVKLNKKDLDRYNYLIKKAVVKLSEKQYIIARNIPANACQVPKGDRRYGQGGELQRLNQFLPANACDYSDYEANVNKKSLLGNVSNADLVKVSDGIRNALN